MDSHLVPPKDRSRGWLHREFSLSVPLTEAWQTDIHRFPRRSYNARPLAINLDHKLDELRLNDPRTGARSPAANSLEGILLWICSVRPASILWQIRQNPDMNYKTHKWKWLLGLGVSAAIVGTALWWHFDDQEKPDAFVEVVEPISSKNATEAQEMMAKVPGQLASYASLQASLRQRVNLLGCEMT